MSALATIDHMTVNNYKNFLNNLKSKILILRNYGIIFRDCENIKDIFNRPEKYRDMFNNEQNLKRFCNNNQLIKRVFNSSTDLKEIFNDNTKLKNIFLDEEKLRKIFSVHLNFYSNINIISPHQILIKTIKKFLYKEIKSVTLRQLNFIEKSKYTKSYLLPLITMLERIYRKKIEFSFINLKYIYNNASVLAESVLNKLKNRKFKPLYVLNKFFNMLQLPEKNKFTLYGEIYNNKYCMQNVRFKDLNELSLGVEKNNNSDSVIFSTPDLLVYDNKINIMPHESNSLSIDPLEQLINNNNDTTSLYKNNINKALTGLKYKFLTGIRIEVAGRLTKRNTAERSVSKNKYAGNLKNTDSSYKGLSTTLLRGSENSSVQYSLLNSKLRTGSFGVKS